MPTRDGLENTVSAQRAARPAVTFCFTLFTGFAMPRRVLLSASIEQEMLSKALGSWSDADLDHIHSLAQRGGLSAEPTPEESSALERLKVLCYQAGT